MSTYTWKLRRLRAMSLSEVFYRGSQKLSSIVERRGYCLALDVAEPLGYSGKPWCDISSIIKNLESTPYISAANDILEGTFKVFALHDRNLGFPPEWNRDPLTKKLAPMSFGKSIDYRDESVVGDIKYLWEINRHLELVTLAQAYVLTSEEKYLFGIHEAIESWLVQCPYPNGVNWTSSLEHAVRLLNWATTWQLIGGDASALFASEEGKEFKIRWLSSIYQHMHFIKGHLSKYSSANNHLLGEYMGLFIGSVTWPFWKESAHWRAFSFNGFLQEVLIQNMSDGVNREQGVWYHHEVADMMLLCGIFGRANGYDFPGSYWDLLEKMLEFIVSLMDCAGNVPMIGDSDDAIMVRYYPGSNNVYGSLMATGAIVFQRSDFKEKVKNIDDKSRWLLGSNADRLFNDLPKIDDESCCVKREFSEGGYWILGHNFHTAEEIKIIADAGPLGYLSIAAHGHADALSFTLSVSGKEILIDPGTYAYHTQKKWRDYFRGTSAHNTIRVDGEDQSVSGGNFLWLNHANATCLKYESSEKLDVWVAEHDGYRRFSDPVTHRRSVALDKANSRINVIDTIDCLKSHEVEIFWHLSEFCEVGLSGSKVVVTCGNVITTLSMPSREFEPELVRGQEDPPLGWVSRIFDQKVPAISVCWRGTIMSRTSLETIIEISQRVVA